MTMRVLPIACLKDNYAYLVVCEETNEAAVVDPSEAAPVERAIDAARVKLKAIWNTHHHWDHVGGNEAIAKKYDVRDVYAHVSDKEMARVPAQTKTLDTGQTFTMGSIDVEAIHIPGHTLGAIAYVARDQRDAAPAVFTGDTLFIAGCGRLFEGTPAMMHASMAKLAALPDETRVYCGHEYTVKNLEFALHVEPDNADVARALERVKATRARGEPSVPGTIGEEKRINPFVRARDVETLAARRKAKDEF